MRCPLPISCAPFELVIGGVAVHFAGLGWERGLGTRASQPPNVELQLAHPTLEFLASCHDASRGGVDLARHLGQLGIVGFGARLDGSEERYVLANF